MDCVFCKIVNGEIPSKKIYEDDLVYAFHDINPVTPVHFLVIPKEHISGANDIDESNSQIVAHIFEVIAKLAKEFDIDKSEYRKREHYEKPSVKKKKKSEAAKRKKRNF